MQDALLIISFVQGLTTIVLLFITWRYVTLTKRLVDLQVEPRIDIVVPRDALSGPGKLARLLNTSKCEVDSVHLQASVGYCDKEGRPLKLMMPIDVVTWNDRLKPHGFLEFDISQYFGPKTEIKAEHDIPEYMKLIRGTVFLAVSFRRTADGREFCFQEPYSVIDEGDGTATMSKVGFRQHLDSLESWIYRRKKS